MILNSSRRATREDFLDYYKTSEDDKMGITNIDFEEVILKHFNNGYEIEISGYKKNTISIYLWKNNHIVGAVLYGLACGYSGYEKLLKEYCIEQGKEIRLDFKNKLIVF